MTLNTGLHSQRFFISERASTVNSDTCLIQLRSLIHLVELRDHVHEQQRSRISILDCVIVLSLCQWSQLPVAVAYPRWT